MIINRNYETMTSKERVCHAINHSKPDRVPINYMTNDAIDKRLKHYLGLKPNDSEELLQTLGVDFRNMGANYMREPLHVSTRTDRIADPLHGWVMRYIANDSGGYWDYLRLPANGRR